MKIGTIRPVIYSFALLLVLYIGAIWFGWFDTYAWFDIPMHFLGGLWVGALFLFLSRGFFQHEMYGHAIERLKIVSLMVAYGSFVGVLWELFEFVMSSYWEIFKQNSIQDTLGDLTMDMIGALAYGLVIFFVLPLFRKKPDGEKNMA